MKMLRHFLRRRRRYSKRKNIIKRYQEEMSKKDWKYPYLRYAIADAKCSDAARKGICGFSELVRWQKARDRYYGLIMTRRPRCNEFFSY